MFPKVYWWQITIASYSSFKRTVWAAFLFKLLGYTDNWNEMEISSSQAPLFSLEWIEDLFSAWLQAESNLSNLESSSLGTLLEQAKLECPHSFSQKHWAFNWLLVKSSSLRLTEVCHLSLLSLLLTLISTSNTVLPGGTTVVDIALPIFLSCMSYTSTPGCIVKMTHHRSPRFIV